MNQEEYKINDFLMFTNLLQLDNCKKVSLKRILYLIKNNNQFFFDIVKYESIFRRFLLILAKMCQAQPTEIKLYSLYVIALRVESLGQKNLAYQVLLNRCFSIQKSIPTEIPNKFLDILFGQLLIGYGLLDIKYAKQIYKD